MATYRMNFGLFDVPGVDLEDATTYVVELRHPEHENATLVVFRGLIPEGKTLRDMAAARVADEMTRLSGYAVLENADVEWFGRPAVDVAARYRSRGEVVYLRQAHLDRGATWIAFALSGPLASRSAIDGWLEQIMTSLRLDDEPG